ncbi:uncharacterized protein LOC131155617 [Malania oleifera]|uniref:uncharacterized protein LOC131155617 n=1 Tax=Malania oleifera TaxID=397392 RepID=UPI0025ADA708|nr:uncharacterized protein LOC131155617 [Malania oleifera]
MGSCVILHNFLPTTHHWQCCRKQTLSLTPSPFILLKSLSSLKKQISLPNNRFKKLNSSKSRPAPVVSAVQSNFFRVLQTVWKVGRDGIEAGTNLVPDAVPRPLARVSVTIVALTVSLFLLKSFLSTAFFVLATMGLVYFMFIALNKDKGPRSGGGTTTTEDSLEEARRIMEKYK